MSTFTDFVKNNRWAQFVAVGIGCFILGIIIAFTIMRTEIITKETQIENLTQTNKELKSSNETLITQNSHLQQQIFQQQHQLITYPNGTTVSTDTNTQTYNDLVTNMEAKYKSQYEEKFSQWKKEYMDQYYKDEINVKTNSISFGPLVNSRGIDGYDGRVTHSFIPWLGGYVGGMYIKSNNSFYFPVGLTVFF